MSSDDSITVEDTLNDNEGKITLYTMLNNLLKFESEGDRSVKKNYYSPERKMWMKYNNCGQGQQKFVSKHFV